ncbi:MAG TPA: nucleoside transporter C-terminal domain-containing protein [Myxococcota bacterium]|nr:nucleoside transporter C-terminal domain-containing protein [Myxococcota bacterium]
MERAVSVVGVFALLGVAYAVSTNRRAIRWRTVAIALALQLAIALLVLRTPWGAWLFGRVNDAADAFVAAAGAGIEFVFGRWPEQVMGPDGRPLRLPFVFAIRVLPIIVFMSSVFAVLQHFGVLQRVVEWLALGLRRSLRTSGAESLAAIAEIFLGMAEAPLLIRTYVPTLTRSELFCVMTAGLATVAGSVLVAYMGMLGPEYAGHLVAASFMAAPAAIAMAKLMVPEEGVPLTSGDARVDIPRTTVNAIDAAAAGAIDGVRLALNIGGMLVAFVALIHMGDALLGWGAGWFGVQGLTFESILGAVLAPLAFLLGVPWHDAARIGELLGVKTVLNEFIAFGMLAEAKATLDPRSVVIASYALCGFANFGSLAIQIGGLGSIAPERRSDVARDALRALLAGSLASFLTAAIAGIVY